MILNLVSGQKDTNGNNNAILGAWKATNSSSTSNPSKYLLTDCFNINNEYFSYNNGIFTVLKNCSVIVTASVQKASFYNSSQHVTAYTTTTFSSKKNGTSYLSIPSGNAGAQTNSLNDNLVINDTLEFNLRVSSSSGAGSSIPYGTAVVEIQLDL